MHRSRDTGAHCKIARSLRRRFIAYADLAAVEEAGPRVDLVYRDGSSIHINVVASTTAPARARVAAAVALSEAEGAAAGADLRRLAARTGDVRVERGFLRIADAASDDEIARALEEAERESAVTARSRA